MPLHDDEMNMRREKREAQRRKQQAEAKRLRITLILAAVVLVLAVLGSFVSFPAGWVGSVLSFLCSPVVLVVAAGVAGLCIRAARGGLRP